MKLTLGVITVMTGHVLRLGAGMVVFVVLARWLGPTAFGQFVYWLAIATLLSIPVNFGFATMVLRSFGTHPDNARETLGNVLSAKLLLAVIAISLGCIANIWIDTRDSALIFVFLLLAQVLESFTEFYVLGFRVNAQYMKETITSSIVSVLHITVMVIAAYMSADVLVVAIAFAVSRFGGLLITRLRCHKNIGAIRLGSPKRIASTLKITWAYAFELGLLTTYGQVDTLIINHYLGAGAVGLYQAGMKLVQGASRIAPVLAQVVLPSLSKAATNKAEFRRASLRSLGVFLFAGIAGAALLLGFPGQITKLLFGNAYKSLVELLPLFGLLLFLRFAETGIGLILVARGLQSSKVWFVALQLALLVTFGTYALQGFGLGGWQIANCSTVALLLLAYLWLWNRPQTKAQTGI